MVTGADEEARMLMASLRQHGLNHNAWQRFITREFIVSDIYDLGSSIIITTCRHLWGSRSCASSMRSTLSGNRSPASPRQPAGGV